MGTKLYSPLFGECYFNHLNPTDTIVVTTILDGKHYTFTHDGKYNLLCNLSNAEVTLFPSKNNRDWNKFEQSQLASYSTEILRAELKRRNAEEKALRQKEFASAHRCRNCKYFEQEKSSFLSNSHICAVRTWGKKIKRHYVVNGSAGLSCNQFVHK